MVPRFGYTRPSLNSRQRDCPFFGPLLFTTLDSDNTTLESVDHITRVAFIYIAAPPAQKKGVH